MYTREAKGWGKHLDFILLDMFCLMVSFLEAYGLRYHFRNFLGNRAFLGSLALVLLIDFALLVFLETLKNVLKRDYYKEYMATLKHTVVLFLTTAGYLYMARLGDDYSRLVIFVMTVMYLVMTYVMRLCWKKVLRKRLSRQQGTALLIIAEEEALPEIIREIRENTYVPRHVIGAAVKDPDRIGASVAGIPVVASYQSVLDYAIRNWVDEVLVSGGPGETLTANLVHSLISMGITVHTHVARDPSQGEVKQVFSNIGSMRVISSSLNYMRPRQALLKRSIDILGGLVGCMITGILYLFLAPAIRRESPGPVFFAQPRVGQNGKIFRFYKFRSMYPDAEERKAELMKQNRRNDDFMFKLDFDPRIIGNRIDEKGNQVTGIGEFIRKYSLDEFPQFWNVLKGDMSLVGTRPPTMDEYRKYQACHKARLAAKPGITGLWQVSGRSNVLNFDEVVGLDTQYINNWSILLDIKILLRTVQVVLRKEGSM